MGSIADEQAFFFPKRQSQLTGRSRDRRSDRLYPERNRAGHRLLPNHHRCQRQANPERNSLCHAGQQQEGRQGHPVQGHPERAAEGKEDRSRRSRLPDKVLYDKAVDATKHGHFDVARLDLQTLLNTYPDSQYQMRAKLAIADSWYKEGGTAALTQAEQEYKDFETFFPNAPEAAEAQMRVGDIYFREMDKPDRDYSKSQHAEEEYRLMLQQYPDSTLVPQAKQRLREVQEVMATRESSIAAYLRHPQPTGRPPSPATRPSSTPIRSTATWTMSSLASATPMRPRPATSAP